MSNTCQYNIFKTYLSHKLANLSWNFITMMREQCPKTTRCKLCCENVGTSHDVKSLAVLAQKNSRALRREENFHKISCFLPIVFWRSLIAPKISWNQPIFAWICLWEIGLFFSQSIGSPVHYKQSLPLLKFYKFVLTMNELLKLWLCFTKEIVTDYHHLNQFLTDFYLRYCIYIACEQAHLSGLLTGRGRKSQISRDF